MFTYPKVMFSIPETVTSTSDVFGSGCLFFVPIMWFSLSSFAVCFVTEHSNNNNVVL